MVWESCHLMLSRRRTSINSMLTDFLNGRPQKQTSKGGPSKIILDFFSQTAFESFRQDIYCLPKLFDRFQLGKDFCSGKNIFIMKNLTDFYKTVETGVDPRLLKQTDFQYLPCSICQSFSCKRGESCRDSIFLAT